MATKKVTKKIRAVEIDNSLYEYEWTSHDDTTYASVNNFYLAYDNVNYYFSKPSGISVGGKFKFNTSTKVLKYNDNTISTSTTGSGNLLEFVPGHKWSNSYINIGADAENVFCSDGKTVEEKLDGLNGDYVEKTGDTMTGPLTTTELSVGTRIGLSAGANSATVGNSGATGIGAFSQGYNCGANGNYSHAEGYFATTYGDHSHAEGYQTIASGDFSHAEGRETQTYGGAQHVEGIYNIVDTSAYTPTGNNYVHIVGNGSSATKSNAHTLDWSGNAWFAGDVYVGSTSGTNKDAGSKKLATENYVDTLISDITNFIDLSITNYPNITNNSSDSNYIYSCTGNTLGEKLKTGIYKVAMLDYMISGGQSIYTPPIKYGYANYYFVDNENKNAIPLDIKSHSGFLPSSMINGTMTTPNIESSERLVTSLNNASTDSQYPSAKAVFDLVNSLPEPMVFKGSLGTEGTITSLPAASSENTGFTYKVITTGTYAGQSAKVGDTFISDGTQWILIPSGDEPSGTVTSITLQATSPIAINSTAAITSSGTRTISHANSGVTAATYKSVTVNATGHVTAGTNPTTLSGYGITDGENTANKITTISSSSTNTQYPSGKAVYDYGQNIRNSVPTILYGASEPTGSFTAPAGSLYCVYA